MSRINEHQELLDSYKANRHDDFSLTEPEEYSDELTEAVEYLLEQVKTAQYHATELEVSLARYITD